MEKNLFVTYISIDATKKVEEHQNFLATAFIAISIQGLYSCLKCILHDIPYIIRLSVNSRKTLDIYVSISIFHIRVASVFLSWINNLEHSSVKT